MNSPYYESTPGGELIRNGSFKTGRPVLTTFYRLLAKSAILEALKIDLPLRVTQHHLDTTATAVREIKDTFERHFPGGQFFVVLYPGQTMTPRLRPELDKLGIRYLDYSDLLNVDDPVNFHSMEDRHPSSVAYTKLASAIAVDLDKQLADPVFLAGCEQPETQCEGPRASNISQFFWGTFVDQLGTGSEISLQGDLSTASEDITTTLRKAADPEWNSADAYPFVGLYANFASDNKPVDISDATQVRLTYKLFGPLSLVLSQTEIAPGEEFRVTLPPTQDFTTIAFDWDKFAQPEWVAKPRTLDLSQLTGVKFQITTPQPAQSSLVIRSVVFPGHTLSGHD